MKMKKIMCLFICLLFAVCFAVSSFAQSGKMEDPNQEASYYVRANGKDSNNGTSEKTPFKTLTKALEVASKTQIKKITVIGTLVGSTSTKHLDPVSFGINDMDTLHSNEILITGKPGATGKEKAVLTSNTEHRALDIQNAVIRLENIELSGCKGGAVIVSFGLLTLAKGAKIINNISGNNSMIFARFSGVILRDDAEISNNKSEYNTGITLAMSSQGILMDNAIVANNQAKKNGGGIAVEDSTLTIKDNALVTKNNAGNVGGGIIAYDATEKGTVSQITISGNAGVIQNNAYAGGGIFLHGNILILDDTARIIENTASVAGGGILGSSSAKLSRGKDVILKGNQAPQAADIGVLD
jgi:predicted outer membrane repeat protein